ncbi:MAG: type II CAAX prenyl endopeptidase Rce1 family protein [Candidatus Hodarchaeota archaeon]
MIDRKYGFTEKEILVYVLLFLIPFYLYINIILFINDLPAFFIPFYSLVGIRHNHNILLFLLYFSVILLKIIGIKIYFSKNVKTIKNGSGDEIFKYFTRDLTYKRVLLLIFFFSLAAFVEELIYRSFLLSIFVYYFNWSFILSIILISVIFGLVHYSTTKNWSHVISTLISSIVYSLALIYLGLLYPWIFHLATNLFVLLFYYQAFRKNANVEVKN